MNEILEFISENAIAITTAIGLGAVELTMLLKGKKEDAQKVRMKKLKLLNRLTEKHKKTEQKYIEEEQEIKQVKEVIENGNEN